MLHRSTGLAIVSSSVLAVWALATPASAFVAMSGQFVASKACTVAARIGGATDGQTQPGRSYRLFGKNRHSATHYRIRLGTNASSDRWVAAGCGRPVRQSGGATLKPGGNKYVLAVSWQAAFCETRPRKLECRSMTARRFDAANFTLHGLWPQPRGVAYCGISRSVRMLDRRNRWSSLPAIRLSPATRARLDKRMPGTMSYLHRHEWVTHGTCYGAPAEKYFADSLALLDQLNRSEVRVLFVANIGKPLRLSEIRRAFDKSFGSGAGQRVNVVCKRDQSRRIITEMRISLAGAVGPSPSLEKLIRSAPRTTSDCGVGIVDPLGFQ